MRGTTAFNFPDSCYVNALITETIVANCAVRISIIEVQVYYFMEVIEPNCAGCLLRGVGSVRLLTAAYGRCRYGVTVIFTSYLGHPSFNSRPKDRLSGMISGVSLIPFRKCCNVALTLWSMKSIRNSLLLAFIAWTIVLGFEPRWDSWSYYHMYGDMSVSLTDFGLNYGI